VTEPSSGLDRAREVLEAKANGTLPRDHALGRDKESHEKVGRRAQESAERPGICRARGESVPMTELTVERAYAELIDADCLGLGSSLLSLGFVPAVELLEVLTPKEVRIVESSCGGLHASRAIRHGGCRLVAALRLRGY